MPNNVTNSDMNKNKARVTIDLMLEGLVQFDEGLSHHCCDVLNQPEDD